MEILNKIKKERVFSCDEASGKINFIEGASGHFELGLDGADMAQLASDLRVVVESGVDGKGASLLVTPVLDRLAKARVFGIYCEDDDGLFTFQEMADHHFQVKLTGEEVMGLASQVEAMGAALASAGPGVSSSGGETQAPGGLSGQLKSRRDAEAAGSSSRNNPGKAATP